MPHVEINCFPGRSDEQKKACAEKIADVIAETLGCKTSSVSVAIKEIAEDDWKELVWDILAINSSEMETIKESWIIII